MNVLLVMADQHAAHMMSCAGTAHVFTPALDALARSGTRFTRAYTTFPLCVPARASIVTGAYPHQLGVDGNGGDAAEPAGNPASLGFRMRQLGYDTAFAGKWHARRPSASPQDGFEVVAPFGDRALAQSAASWLRSRAGQERPFLLVVSFDDPHSICEFARRQAMPYGQVSPPPPVRDMPPLPNNHGPFAYEPEALRHEQARAAASYGTSGYGPDDWRGYRRAYAELVERADANVGAVLSALDESGLADETVVVYTSDHGDGDASHGWNQKTALYEESCRVPLIVRDPRRREQHRVSSALVSVGLDLLPTCLGAANDSSAGSPQDQGANVLNLLSGGPGRDEVVVETLFQRPLGDGTSGRALIAERFKYVVYGWGADREQLFDLVNDPGETRNLAAESAFDHVLEQLRQRLLNWCLRTDDATFLKRLALPADTSVHVRDLIFETPY